MQFIDIAVASGYAAICVSLIVAISPIAPREAAVDAAAQARLDTAITAYLDRVGLPFLSSASERAVCDSAAEAGNATLVIGVAFQGTSCGSVPEPSSALASASLPLDLPGRTLVIEAWLARQ